MPKASVDEERDLFSMPDEVRAAKEGSVASPAGQTGGPEELYCFQLG